MGNPQNFKQQRSKDNIVIQIDGILLDILVNFLILNEQKINQVLVYHIVCKKK